MQHIIARKLRLGKHCARGSLRGATAPARSMPLHHIVCIIFHSGLHLAR
jgi:hypothetical protein